MFFIMTVVTTDYQRDTTLKSFRSGMLLKTSDSLGDIHHPRIITTHMSSHQFVIYVHLHLLARALKLQDRAPVTLGVVNG